MNSLSAACALLLLLGGCTTVGTHTKARSLVDYGPPATIRVCLVKTDDVPQVNVDRLIAAVGREFSTYGIAVEVPWIRPWRRPGFQVDAIMEELMRMPLEPPCDRLVGLVDRHLGDFVWGLFLPEVLGAVDDASATRGYVVATFGSVNQLFVAPEQAAVHEFYHLLGCPHGNTLTQCYPRIAAVKAANDPQFDFFPVVLP